MNDGFDASANHVEWYVFVRGMDGITFQSEAHEDGFDAENLFEGGMIGMLPPRRTGRGRCPKAASNPFSAAL